MDKSKILTWQEVCDRLQPHGRLGNLPDFVYGLSHDSRSILPHETFLAIQGERFDGHQFLVDLPSRGVSTAIAEQGLAQAGISGIEVTNTKKAYLDLAQLWRQKFTLPLIAVAGSNGKTTVTQMIKCVLQAHLGARKTLATQGNLNNAIGVPMTLLRLNEGHQAAVLELGSNHPDEITTLGLCAQPTVALVNNAHRDHAEFFLTLEQCAKENGSIYRCLVAGGTAVFPADDIYTPLWHSLSTGYQQLSFGRSSSADIRLIQAKPHYEGWNLSIATPAGPITCHLAVLGEHHIHNVLATVACCLAIQVPVSKIAEGIADFRALNGRGNVLHLNYEGQAIALINDCYNANPDSMRVGLDALTRLPKKNLAILADMAELGRHSQSWHQEIGAYAQSIGIDEVWTYGQQSLSIGQSFGYNSRHFEDFQLLLEALATKLPTVNSILLKGSRSMRLERILHLFTPPDHVVSHR